MGDLKGSLVSKQTHLCPLLLHLPIFSFLGIPPSHLSHRMSIVGRTKGSGARLPGFKSWFYPLLPVPLGESSLRPQFPPP